MKPNVERNPAANSIFGNWLLLSWNKLRVMSFLEWGTWEAWTTDKNGEKKRLRYQLMKGEKKYSKNLWVFISDFFN